MVRSRTWPRASPDTSSYSDLYDQATDQIGSLQRRSCRQAYTGEITFTVQRRLRHERLARVGLL